MSSFPASLRSSRWFRGQQKRSPQSQAVAFNGKAAIEESIPLRFFVQMLVSTGILATDIAAGTWMSVWAIPLSILGGWWSWRQRHQPNIATKFVLAFGMLAALGFFLSRIFASVNDTRLVLAELLVQLQVLHSFDLPRRKNLGYSMMIGLVLLGVAGTLSQTLAFGLLLLCFLAIAIPTLVLDYYSRSGLPTKRWQWRSPVIGLPVPEFAKFFVLILVLGLIIFAALPRLPGFQVRTFPVSSTIDFQGEFKGSEVTNPGYIRNGTSHTTTKLGGQGEGSTTEQDNTAYYGFSNSMDQRAGAVTPMKPKVVLRVRSQAPGFWRVLSFDRYTGHGWDVSRKKDVSFVNRDAWSYRFFLHTLSPSAPSKEVVQTYTVVSELPNLVPVLPNAKSIYFPTRQLGLDPEDTLRAPVILTEDLTYTVISNVPYRDLDRLQKAPTAYPKTIQDYYLPLPQPLASELKSLAQEWMKQANSPLTNPYDTAWFLAQYLKQHYSIQPDFPQLAEGQDLVQAFLKQQGGYPDHFATVLTLMLRSLGIPARVAVGFGSGQFNPFTGYYVVQNIDAHAITEVFIPDNGWFSFDPIPGQDLIPPSVEESQTFGVLRQFWSWVAGWLPSPVRNGLGMILSSLLKYLTQFMQWFLDLFSQGWGGIGVGLTLGLGFAYSLWLGWQGWCKWRYWKWLTQLPPMEQIYQQLLTLLRKQGYIKSLAQTPLEFVDQIQPAYSPVILDAVDLISQSYVGWRYGDRPPNLQELNVALKQLQRTLKRPTLKRSPFLFKG